MSTPDRLTDEERAIRARAEAAASLCGPCDGGLPMGCTCDPEPRAVIVDLLTVVDALAARLAAQPPAIDRDAPCPMARQEFDRAVGAAVDESRALDAGRADDLARAVSLIAEAACTAGPKQMGAAHALGILGEVARVGVGAQAEDVARALADRPAPDTLADRVQALRALSDRATPGIWWQEFYRDGELLPDGTGGIEDDETPGIGVYAMGDDGYSPMGFDTASASDAAFIVAAVKLVRALLAGRSDVSPEERAMSKAQIVAQFHASPERLSYLQQVVEIALAGALSDDESLAVVAIEVSPEGGA